MAQAWARGFWLPGAKSEPAQSKLLRDALEPPFSFVYADRQSTDLLPTWKFGVKDSDVDATKHQQEVFYTDPETGLVVRAVATSSKTSQQSSGSCISRIQAARIRRYCRISSR